MVQICAESYCFDQCQNYVLVSASDANAKFNASATLNLAGTSARAAYITNGYYVAATFALSSALMCAPTNPGACAGGLTVALWARVDAPPVVGGAPVVLLNSGPPAAAGVSLHLVPGSYPTSTSAVRVVLVAVVDTGARTWTASVELDAGLLVGAWHNYALSWSSSYGIFIFVDGLIVGALLPQFRVLLLCALLVRYLRVRLESNDFSDAITSRRP